MKQSKYSLTESCWKNYKQVGMKKKGNKMVPDCVPKNKKNKSIEENYNLSFKTFFLEQLQGKLIIIFPGRFQPFHIGHKKLYDLAKSKFPNADFYITTANPTDQQIAQEPDRYPFTFEEKRKIMEATGIPSNEIIQTPTPYIPKDLLSRYNPETDKVIFLVGEKDMKEDPRFGFKPLKSGKPSYYQPFQDLESTVSLKEHGYIYAPSTITFMVNGKLVKSASELRNMFITGDEQIQKNIVTSLVGKYNPEIHKILINKLTNVNN